MRARCAPSHPKISTVTSKGPAGAGLRQPLVHVACAWDGWLAEHAGDTFTDFDIDTINTWDAIENIRATTRAWMRRILDDMPDTDLFEKTEPASAHPDANRVTAADAFLHIFLHERGHHGDISTLFSQLGVPLGGNDYLVYRFFKDRKRT
jgi:uncharacterized damage-inducible protein DinB